MVIQYGVIPIYHHGDAQNTTGYVFTYDTDEVPDPYKAIGDALTELANDDEFCEEVAAEYNPKPITVRDAFVESDEEVFRHHGITFVWTYAEMPLDGDELLDNWKRGAE